MSERETQQLFEVGDFRVDAVQRVLFTADGARVTLPSRAFELLLCFVRHPGELLDKNRLMDAVWPSSVVEENNLNQCVGALRRALGETPGDHRYVVTEPGRGYRLVAPVRVVAREVPPTPSSAVALASAARSRPPPPARLLALRLGVALALGLVIALSLWFWARGSGPAPAAAGASISPAAQEAYRRARAYAERTTRSESDIRNAILAYEEAVRLDPNFADAWAQLSRRHANLFSISYDRSAQRREAARAALNRAVQLAPNDIDTRLAQGYFAFRVEANLDEAERIYRELAAAGASRADVSAGLAQVTREAGRWQESLTFSNAALAADPQNPYRHAIICEDYLTGRELMLATKACDRALDLLPGDVGTLALKASIYQAQGDLARARELLNGIRPAPGDWRTLEILSQQLALDRDPAAGARLLETYLANPDALGTRLGPLRRRFADTQRLLHGEAAARSAYEMAQRELTQELTRQPENPSLVAEAALVEARLGNHAVAAQLTARCSELAARARRDSLDAECLAAQAEVALLVGRIDDALKSLEVQLTRRGALPPLTPRLLQLDPRWSELRKHPRFAQLR